MANVKYNREARAKILKEAEGSTVEAICKKYGVSVGTFYNWRTEFKQKHPKSAKGMAKKILMDASSTDPIEENKKLKVIVADLLMEKYYNN